MLKVGPRTLTRPAEINDRQRGRKCVGAGPFGGLALTRTMPETAPTLALWAEKNPTDKGWVFGKWWRRRELNPRPQILCHRFYMRIHSIGLAGRYPSGREDGRRFRWVLALRPRTDFSASLQLGYPQPAACKRAADQRPAGLSGQCVNVVVGVYLVCRWIYEVICTSACTSGFAIHVEAMSPPG